jgi:membrane protein DedA with SNARE-associated domain/rhodanese-related sulfurtransferase
VEAVIQFVQTYGLWVVFFAVLLDQGGLPLPAYPVIIVTAALAVNANEPIVSIICISVIAVLLADVLWFYGGRRFGGRLLKLMCRLSLSPDSCVSLTRRVYARWGAPSLIVAKYVPGFAAVATTLAGEAGTGLGRFLIFDAAGAALWALGAVAIGVIFNDAVAAVLADLEKLGRLATALLACAIALYISVKWWQRQRFLARIRMARISPDELEESLKSSAPPIVLDVRMPESRTRSGWIPGSIAAPLPDGLSVDPSLEVVVYCDCPNDASAAIEAKRLLDLGFIHVRPLAGGFDSWRDRGLPIETTR